MCVFLSLFIKLEKENKSKLMKILFVIINSSKKPAVSEYWVSILDGVYQCEYLCLSAFLGAGTLLGRQQNDRPSHCLGGPWGWMGARSWASHQPSAKRQSPDPNQRLAQAGCQEGSWVQTRLAQRDSAWRPLHMWSKERVLPAHPCFPRLPPPLHYCLCPSP